MQHPLELAIYKMIQTSSLKYLQYFCESKAWFISFTYHCCADDTLLHWATLY